MFTVSKSESFGFVFEQQAKVFISTDHEWHYDIISNGIDYVLLNKEFLTI